MTGPKDHQKAELPVMTRHEKVPVPDTQNHLFPEINNRAIGRPGVYRNKAAIKNRSQASANLIVAALKVTTGLKEITIGSHRAKNAATVRGKVRRMAVALQVTIARKKVLAKNLPG